MRKIVLTLLNKIQKEVIQKVEKWNKGVVQLVGIKEQINKLLLNMVSLLPLSMVLK